MALCKDKQQGSIAPENLITHRLALDADMLAFLFYVENTLDVFIE